MKSPPRRRGEPNRKRILTFVVIFCTLAVLFAVLPGLAKLYTDFRWFHSLGLEDVFSKILWTRVSLGAAAGLLVGLLLFANATIAERLSSRFPTLKLRDPQGAIGIDLGALAPRVFRVVIVAIGVVTGISVSDQWHQWLRYQEGASFGTRDPIFGRDIGFYVFTMPVLEAAYDLALWTLGIGSAMAVALFVTRGGIVLEGRPIRVEPKARKHLSVLAILFFGLLAFDSWLSMSKLLYSTRGPVFGASYADVHASLPLLKVQLGVAVLGAILIGVSMTRKRLVLAAVAVGTYLAITLLGVNLYPYSVHRFSVKPNEKDKESEYIAYNIESTRAAYGLEDVEERELSGESHLTLADIEENRATIENIRLWDHDTLLLTFAQIQEIRPYYEFQSVDNDRYVLNGELRQTMLSPRELKAESLPNRTWITEHFTFTHGYGVTLGPVNQATPEGLPILFIQDIPPVSSIEGVTNSRPGIYFGELSNDYVFVHTQNEEFDYPSGDQPIYQPYEGRDGISLSSFVDRATVAMHVGSLQLLLSEDLGGQSRILLYRNIRQRVQRIAPFLIYDQDPYLVVRENGELVWIQDAYSVTNRYPYSQPTTEDSINYIRNSVKVTIDAYDGTVHFYIADPDDPILQTWRAVFPSLFEELSAMPEDLRAHIRFPEDLFDIQAKVFSTYHMTGPDTVYDREDQWEIPSVTRQGVSATVEPYYTIMRLPGESTEDFIQMLPFTPKNKENLSAWMVARMNADGEQQLVVYRFPKDRLIFGPAQIMNRINQETEISRQISLWDQRGSAAVLGTLLVIPIEESLIYVCPLYLKSSGGRIPELKRVIVVYENRIAMEETLDEAVTAVFGERAATPVEGPPDVTDEEPDAIPDEPATAGSEVPPPGEPGLEPLSADPRIRARQLLDRATAAQREGDWAGYGEYLDELSEVLRELADEAENTPEPETPTP